MMAVQTSWQTRAQAPLVRLEARLLHRSTRAVGFHHDIQRDDQTCDKPHRSKDRERQHCVHTASSALTCSGTTTQHITSQEISSVCSTGAESSFHYHSNLLNQLTPSESHCWLQPTQQQCLLEISAAKILPLLHCSDCQAACLHVADSAHSNKCAALLKHTVQGYAVGGFWCTIDSMLKTQRVLFLQVLLQGWAPGSR